MNGHFFGFDLKSGKFRLLKYFDGKDLSFLCDLSLNMNFLFFLKSLNIIRLYGTINVQTTESYLIFYASSIVYSALNRYCNIL